MKKSFITGIMLLPFVASATFPSLLFKTVDGTEHYISVEGLEITVGEENLVATSNDGKLECPVANLVSMEFSEKEAAGIDEINVNNGVGVIVYSTDGVKKGVFTNQEEAEALLPAGIYIMISADGKTAKTVVK